MRTPITALLSVLACAAAALAVPAHAQSSLHDARDMRLFRFDLDNDTFLGSDDAFTAGWSVQFHWPLHDEWPAKLERWVGDVPGLGDDGPGGRVVRQAWGVTQLAMTPENISTPRPQPNDLPWAGMLGVYVSWSSYDDDRLAALQLYLGCIGPCSRAEEAQKLVHNSLGLGDEPEGWPNQIADRPLVNVSYEYRNKLWSSTRDNPRGWSHDASLGVQVGLGTFATYAQAWLEYRFGWDVPEGFTNLAEPPAFGVALDPVYVSPSSAVRARTWRPHFSVVWQLRSVGRFAPLEGGLTDNDRVHPGFESTPGSEQLLIGVHVTKVPLAFHLMFHRFVDDDEVRRVTGGSLDWVSFSFERRFGRRVADAGRG